LFVATVALMVVLAVTVALIADHIPNENKVATRQRHRRAPGRRFAGITVAASCWEPAASLKMPNAQQRAGCR
jgi:hypothetical protein